MIIKKRNKSIKDYSTSIGIAFSIAMIFISIYLEGSSFSSFFNLNAFLIVGMGTFFVTISCFSFSDVLSCAPVVIESIFFRPRSTHHAAIELLQFAEEVRNIKNIKGIEDILKNKNFDPFFAKGMSMIIDGTPEETIEKLLNQELNSNINSYNKAILIMRKAAETSPAMGLIGTLIGLVQMLGNLSNPKELGPSMAIALLTTFYGAILSYMFFFPLASKIERNAKEEYLLQNLYLKTTISITQRENPRHLEAILNSLLDSSNKVLYFSKY